MAGTIILSQGSTGADVSAWQDILGSNGYDLTVDGLYGPETAAATTQFQTELGVQNSGNVDTDTITAYNAANPDAPFVPQGSAAGDVLPNQTVTASGGSMSGGAIFLTVAAAAAIWFLMQGKKG